MDSDLIRREIEATARRIDAELQLLASRTRRTARTTVGWSAIVIAAAGLITGVMLWRRRRRASARVRLGDPPSTAQRRSAWGPRAARGFGGVRTNN